MVAYNFKKQFAPKVAALEKLQTIRGVRKRHAAPGEAIQLYTGMRTRYCQKLVTPDPVCVSVTPIVITASSIQLDGLVLLGNQVDYLAASDGFESASGLFEFFKETHGFPFSGVLIRWRGDRDE